MEHPEGQPPDLLENDSTPTVSTSEATGSKDPQISVDNEDETVGYRGAENASYQVTQTAADHVTKADADSGTQAGATAPQENLPEGKGKWPIFFFPHRLRLFFGRKLLEVYLNRDSL